MSRFDQEHERQEAEQQRKDAAELVVGATVYRARYDRVETGVVRRVSRAKVTSSGGTEEDEHGEYPYYVAQFGGRGDWDGQTHSWKWFAQKERARRDLARQICNRIEERQREIKRLEGMLSQLLTLATPE
jgi:hypothetical protein